MSLKFSPANAKTAALKQVVQLQPFLANKRRIYSLDLLSGYSCPFARECLSKAVVGDNGKRTIKDGPHTQFRCFSASQEVQYTNVYNARKHNFDLLRERCKSMSVGQLACSISSDMPDKLGILRIHVAGDFFSPKYFAAMVGVAKSNPDRLFYAYTKSLTYWVDYLASGIIPENFVLTASRGGRSDALIQPFELRETVVVFSEQEAADKNLVIDHDDSHAAVPQWKDMDFALLIHGTQPPKSAASKALRALKGVGSYNRKKGGVK